MSNLIACRIASYGEFEQAAWTHLPQIGIFHVEMAVPAAGQVDDARRRLADSGLSASSLQAECDVRQADAVEVMRPQLAACAELGVGVCFVSMRADDADRAALFDRLRAIGDIAAAAGVTVVLETHPDLVTNGDVGAETMAALDHPHVRVNFDTANVYYYNHDVTAEGELAKVIDYVASVHLKDTTGGYECWDFPALGTGVVDFPKVLAMLAEHRFAGPLTMELEGTEGVKLDEGAQLKYVEDSAAYLRAIGAFD